jgi:hypothetical protein
MAGVTSNTISNIRVDIHTLSSGVIKVEFIAGKAFDIVVLDHLAGPFGAYAEVYGSNRERPAGPSTHYLHGAITCRVRSWMHFDLHAGLGSAAAGSPRWIGIGVRQRIAR